MKRIIFLSLIFLTKITFSQNPPTNVSIGAGTAFDRIGVNWSYVSGYSSYEIWRALGASGDYEWVGTKNGVTNSSNAKFTDTTVSPLTQYCYKIKTCGSTCSALSNNYACDSTPDIPPPPTYSISGTITASGSGLSGVSVNFAGYSATTNSTGYYSINNVLNTNSFITPSKSGYTFIPNNIHITYIDDDLTNQNFTANSTTIAAPNLTATATDADAVQLNWNSVTGANYYKVFFSNGNEYTSYITSTSRYVTGLTTNQQACFYVKAYQTNNGSGLVSPNSNTACATPTNTVPAPTVSLTNTNSGTFTVGSTINITWSSTNQHHYGIYLYKGGEAESNQIGNIVLPPNSTDQSYNWTIDSTLDGQTINGNDYKIKIVVWNSDGVPIGDYSSNYLTINPASGNTPAVTITHPNNAETFNVGETINIQWTSTNQAQYIVHLYEGGTETGNQRALISHSTNDSSTQNINWEIPASVDYNGNTYDLAGSDYKIGVLIRNSDNDPTEDFSNQFFTINSNDTACSFPDDELETGTEISDAVSFLCGESMLEDDDSCEPNDQITRAALAKLAFLSIDLDNNTTVTNTIDGYPTPFQDLQDETTWFYSYAKNLSYLEYGDGKSPFDKTFFNFYASRQISRAHALKVLLEAWNVTIQSGSGLPYTDEDLTEHDSYDYIYTAYQLGLIEDNDPQHVFGPDVGVYRSEIFIWLYRIMDTLSFSVPTPTATDFYEPGNYTPSNFAAFKGLHSGNFNHYTKTSFAIASVGIPLGFEHTYNSYLSEMPNELSALKPLGKMWSHTYNSYVKEIVGDVENPNDYRVAVSLPNSGFHIYKLEGGNYVNTTQGVYNILKKPTGDKFTITTKNQIVYTYQKLGSTSDDYPFVLKTVNDRNGNTLAVNYENSHDANHPYHKRIKEVVGTSGRKLQFFYHLNTNLVDYIQDPLNRKVYYTYGADGKLATFKDAKNQTTTYNYGASNGEEDLLLSIQLPKGNTVTNTYLGKKLASSQTNGNTPTQYVYNRNYGQSASNNYTKATVTSPNGEVSDIDYNKNGNPHKIVKDNNTDVTIAYNPTQTSKPENITIDGKSAGLTYDNMGNVLTVNLPMGVSYKYIYNGNNDITQYTDPLQHNYTYQYTNGNLTQTTTPRGSTQFGVNSKGLVTSVTNPVGIQTTYTYDNYGNLKTTAAPEGINTASTYDIASRLKSFTNPNGRSITYQYDNNDNLFQETFNGKNTSYEFDPNDNLKKITNANGGATTMAYDFDNDFLESVNFGSATDTYTYFDDGKVKTYKNPNNQTFTYTYDTEGRLKTVTTTGDTVTYTYDAHNNIETMANTNGTITYTYDALNRVTSTKDYFNNTVSYTYDANSNVKKITYPGTKAVNYTYHNDNLLHTVKDWNNQTTTYTYRADGLLNTVTYPNGTYSSYTYDNAGRQTGMAWKNSSNVVINEYTHTLDAIGNHLSETKTEPYTASSLPDDAVTYTHNSTNQVQTANGTSSGNVTFGYDTNGNTTSKTGNTYTFDAYDNLKTVTGSIAAQYQYDAAGNRRKSTISGTEKRYVLDVLGMSKVLIEMDASNTAQNYYVYGLGLISRIDATNQTRYYHYDFRGSTIAMTNESETITHKYEYNDFGQVVQNEEEDTNAYRYVGKYGVAYEDTNLYFMRARYYNPDIGRFLSEDPIWSTNLYPYADNNPVTRIDPEGKTWKNVGSVLNYLKRTYKENKQLEHSKSMLEKNNFSNDDKEITDYDPKINYCGSESWGQTGNSSARILGQSLVKGTYPNKSCYKHDKCYSDDLSKKECDTAFYNNMRDETSFAVSLIYHKLVDKGGQKAYDAAQENKQQRLDLTTSGNIIYKK